MLGFKEPDLQSFCHLVFELILLDLEFSAARRKLIIPNQKAKNDILINNRKSKKYLRDFPVFVTLFHI